jgi:hypothetical protein
MDGWVARISPATLALLKYTIGRETRPHLGGRAATD